MITTAETKVITVCNSTAISSPSSHAIVTHLFFTVQNWSTAKGYQSAGIIVGISREEACFGRVTCVR